ncbi:threonine aldolase family protein [Pedomonas mirosovicensis]|uniref:threonine aldolase family protein n=1 Tax=Pedomonas mirosovicensis TaxID=2908641 RepID=UPI00216AAD0E|nr:beta-eliminating lyase-related protein [Pedomonas mirosovicensis]MCH8684488.1 beta-eliminating lyase-related protein [Pedomonas mirosovicensis]
MRFTSDNTATVSPEILSAIVEANAAPTTPYDGDPWSSRLSEVFSNFFGAEVEAFAVTSGTAANSLALACMTPPFGAVVCHREAHINVDECGAPEFYTGGAKLLLAEGRCAKITPESFAAVLADMRVGDVHQVQPKVLSLTQATELGCVYTPAEVAALAGAAKARGMTVHMDGARFANALAHLDCHPADITWKAGVDALSFGATKNGALAAEAVIFFNRDLAAQFPFRRKRGGHLLCKGRYISAQLLAYIETGLWRRNAERANAMAQRLAQAARGRLLYPVEANELFLNVGIEGARQLRAEGFEFYDWGAEGSGQIRLVVSWDQVEVHVEALAAALESLPV